MSDKNNNIESSLHTLSQHTIISRFLCVLAMTKSYFFFFFFFIVSLAVVVFAMVVHAGEDGVVCIESDGQQQKGLISSDDSNVMSTDGSETESVVSQEIKYCRIALQIGLCRLANGERENNETLVHMHVGQVQERLSTMMFVYFLDMSPLRLLLRGNVWL